MDRGANGGILGCDANVILIHTREVDVTGIDNHELNALKLVDASAKVITQLGPAIVILRQYAYHGRDRSIHSAGQIEHYKNTVNDRSMKVGGSQHVRTNEGYILPLDIINGLPYLKMTPNTDQEFEELPHLVLAGGNQWDPRVLDHNLTDRADWFTTLKDFDEGLMTTPFDAYGNYKSRTPDEEIVVAPPILDNDDDMIGPADFRAAFHDASNLDLLYTLMEQTTEPYKCYENETIKPRETKPVKVNYKKYRPYFLHVSEDKVRHTFKSTTQFATNVMSGHNIVQTIKSPYPALNVRRQNEPVASDTIFAEVAAIGTGGQTMAQLFIGRKSLIIDVYGMSTEKQFVNTLEDVIRKRGAMDKLITDSAAVEVSKRVLDILRALCIDGWQSEANYQHQNFAEHRWKHIKHCHQWFMNWRNVDANAWLLLLEWIADVMNHTAEESLGWKPPLQTLTGQTIDISIMLYFLFWDVVYVSRYDDAQYRGQIGSDNVLNMGA